MKKIIFLFTLCNFLLFTYHSIGQSQVNQSIKYNKLSIGLNYGTLVSFANIKENDFLPTSNELSFGGGVRINYHFSNLFSLGLNGIYGNLKGTKTKFITGQTANLKFDATVMETSLLGNVNFLKWWAPKLKINNFINFYGFIGVGLIQFRSILSNSITNEFIYSQGYSNEGNTKAKMTTEAILPLGIGMNVKLSKKLTLNLETGLRYINSTKLDSYIRYNGNNDKYNYTCVGINYTFGKNEQSMEWKKDFSTPNVCSELIENQNNKIEQITTKVAEIESKTINNQNSNNLYDKKTFDELNEKITLLQQKIIDIENNRPNNSIILNNSDSINLLINKLVARIEKLEKENKNITIQPTEIIKETNLNSQPNVLLSIFFETGKTEIKSEYKDRIAAVALFLKNDPNSKLLIVGHADKTGKQKVNIQLSKKRAENVRSILVYEFDISPDRIQVQSKGNTIPLSKDEYNLNRRVDFTFYK